MVRFSRLIAFTLTTTMAAATAASAETVDAVSLRGHPQTLHLYGTRGSGNPVIVSSGDGGWMHLGPHVAQLLASRGFFVVGFDVRAYPESFTSRSHALEELEEPGDYRTLIEYAARGGSKKPILVGVSEGAGLSVLAASDPRTKSEMAGVIGLGLPDLNELGWRWQDSMIYVTHGLPTSRFSAPQPSFRASRLFRLPRSTRRTTSSCPSPRWKG